MSKASKHAHTQPFMRASELEELKDFHGSTSVRLSKDSQRQWDCCCLTLMPIKGEAVVTPEGHLFSREALLENLLAQKQRYKRELAAYKLQRAEEAADAASKEHAAEKEAEAAFTSAQEGLGGGARKRDRAEDARAPNYWLQVPDGVKRRAVKPRKGTVSPESGTPLTWKEVVPVELQSTCAACASSITNKSRMTVLDPTGTLVCAACVAADGTGGVRDPLTGQPCRAIVLKRGGTGYAGNEDVASTASKDRLGFQLG